MGTRVRAHAQGRDPRRSHGTSRAASVERECVSPFDRRLHLRGRRLPMPLTERLLVTALALVTLSLSPLESFAGPLQGAIHTYPPDWLTRTGPRPRQTHIGMPCGSKLLLGLGIGAGVGLGFLTLMA